MTAHCQRNFRRASGVARAVALALWLGAGPAFGAAAGGTLVASGHEHAVARLLADGDEPDCPTSSDLGERVNQLLGREVVAHDDQAEDVRVYWRVEPGEDGVVAHFRLLARDGREIGAREVRAQGACAMVRDRFALVLSLMLDIPEEAWSAPPARESRFGWFEAEAGVSGSVGWLPSPRVGAALALRGHWHGWPAVAAGVTFWPRTRFDSGAGAYDLRAFTANIVVSPMLAEAPWGRVTLGLGLHAGLMAARGVGFPRNASSSVAIADATLELEAAGRLVGPLWVRGSLGPAVPLVRPRVVFLDFLGTDVEAFRASKVHGLATVSLVAHF